MTGDTSAVDFADSDSAGRASRSRRLKSLSILAVILWSALVFLAWSQPWFTLSAQGRAGDTVPVTVQGAVAAPALSALALAGLALSAALAIAGRIIRVILGVLELVLGVSIASSAIAALADPVSAGQSAVTTATGVAGTSSISQIATASGTQVWPYLALFAGILMGFTGVVIAVTVRRWPESGRKYQPVRFAAADGRTAGNPVDLIVVDGVTPPTEGSADGWRADASDAASGSEASVSADMAATPDASVPPVPRDVNTARAAAVDSWDSLSRGVDPTGDDEDTIR